MALTDQEIIKKLKILSGEKVLDIGGSLKQHQQIEIDTLVDLMRPEKVPYWPSKLRAKHFVQADITREKLPFKDKEFDVCLCTHTLEDLYNPFNVIEEMSRVAKRGYIATPSRGREMEFSRINFTDWFTGARRYPGFSHHHWFFENRNNQIRITTKVYPILYTPEFFVTKWTGEEEFRYFWEGKINYTVTEMVDTHKIIEDYRNFAEKNKNNIQRGPVLFYIDNPFYFVRELAKLLVKKAMRFP